MTQTIDNLVLDSETLITTESREKEEIQTTPLLPNYNKETLKTPSKYTDDVSSHILKVTSATKR